MFGELQKKEIQNQFGRITLIVPLVLWSFVQEQNEEVQQNCQNNQNPMKQNSKSNETAKINI